MMIDPSALTPAQLRRAATELLAMRGVDLSPPRHAMDRLNQSAQLRAAELEVIRYLQVQAAVYRALLPTT